MRYKDFVDYDKLDPFKEAAIARFRRTLRYPRGARIIEESLGETAVVLDVGPVRLAFNVEGLGTKNRIAEEMAHIEAVGRGAGLERRALFGSVGECTMMMSLNDLSGVGAAPLVYGSHVASGDSAYFDDKERWEGLLDGYERGAELGGVALPCGETPTLPSIVAPGTLELSGASLGIIAPKERMALGERLGPGLAIYGFESSGIHANGVSMARRIAEQQENGYFTALPSGRLLGEALLAPTLCYAPLVEALFEQGVDVRYLQPITGHGWAKLMRKKRDLRYVIEALPEPPEELAFLREAGSVDSAEAYGTWNMGVGFVLMAPRADAGRVQRAAQQAGLRSYELGDVRRGERSVVLGPLDVTYKPR